MWFILSGISFGVHCSLDTEKNYTSVRFYSEAIKRIDYFLVFKPEDENRSLPVLYLLNPWGVDAYNWPSGADLSKGCREFNMYIVSLSAGANPYVNSMEDTTKKYEDYVIEIINAVDENFNTKADKGNRGISGISNGGGGALYLAARHPDMFNSVSALSAGSLGYVYPWIGTLKRLKILFDCGKDDQLIDNNRYLHSQLQQRNIDHLYKEHKGEHNWDYWSDHYWDHFKFHAISFRR